MLEGASLDQDSACFCISVCLQKEATRGGGGGGSDVRIGISKRVNACMMLQKLVSLLLSTTLAHLTKIYQLT